MSSLVSLTPVKILNRDDSNTHELPENTVIFRSSSENRHNRFWFRATHGMDNGDGKHCIPPKLSEVRVVQGNEVRVNDISESQWSKNPRHCRESMHVD